MIAAHRRTGSRAGKDPRTNAPYWANAQSRWRRTYLVVALVVLGWNACAFAAQETTAIASAHPLATAAGRAMLDRGGNAFDAAIAVAAALAVVEPYSSGLGGGGFFLLHRATDGLDVMIDARETAPDSVTSAQYFDSEGRPLRGASIRGGTAAAIPGLPAGLAHLAQRYGRLPLSVTLEPAVRLARDGFRVDTRYARIAQLRESFLQSSVDTGVFLDRGRAPKTGFLLKQAALANTLERFAQEGAQGFYAGVVAQALIDSVNRAGGSWRASDLTSYTVLERTPVRFTYRGATITAASLPSAGGVALAQCLAILDRFSARRIGDPETDHLVVEAMRRAFHDRARYLGDPDFVAVPTERLLSREYAQQRASGIDPLHATRSDTLDEFETARFESHDTTHFSIVDAQGNRVAATLTINLLFGSGIVADGTGVLLNNEMDDFSLRPDVPNAFRLRGGSANAIEPRKRPLSSMTPTFVEDEKGVLVLGAPGGSRIVSQVLLAILRYLQNPQVDLATLMSLPRYHHQYWPDRLEIEPDAFTPQWQAAMSAKGHILQRANRPWGNMHAVFKSRLGGVAQAASDPRGDDIGW
jgi:gamma-glutamyltranspeptidase/glutathione hydrolase